MEREIFAHFNTIAKRRGEKAPTYEQTLRWVRERKKRDFTPQEVTETIAFAAQFLTSEEISALQSTLSLAGDDIAGYFENYGKQYYQDGLDHAYNEMKRSARPQDPARFAMVPTVYVVNDQNPLVRNFLNNGMELVTSRLTQDYTGRLFSIIGNAFSEGASVGRASSLVWRSIAENTHDQVGMGASWHWKRLVRSEAMRAYGFSARERAINAGIQYERLSLARTACPICQSAKGTYVLGQGPILPIHPNCRCTWIHYYRLPSGITTREAYIIA